MSKKIVVTNASELSRKYAKAGLSAIKDELKKWNAADDKKRGLDASVVYLDDAQSMKPYGSAVTDASNPKQNKTAIDAIFAKETPDYLTILGAPDVVPYQDLINPVYDPSNDTDPMALGDLPYASDKPYSRDISTFLGVTRVVGRLPDLTCARDGEGQLDYLVGVIRAAAGFETQARPTDYFGLSAAVWTQSTELSLKGIFGDDQAMFNCPPHNQSYTPTQLSKLAQFVNCHGAAASPSFYGQDPNNQTSFPVALDSSQLKGIAAGTVAAFECCYAAELYDPAAAQNVMSIASRYLAEKACGLCASTTIAYGPADSNAQADLLCRYFLIKVLNGASIGRAMLEARMEFIRAIGTLSPVDLKTLGQFVLLGDPSLQPFSASQSPVEAIVTTKKVTLAPADEEGDAARTARRQKLAQFGAAAGAVASYAIEELHEPGPAIRKFLASQLKVKESKIKVRAFGVRHPRPAFFTKNTAKLTERGADKHYVIIDPRPTKDAPFIDLVGLVASEIHGRMIVRKFRRR